MLEILVLAPQQENTLNAPSGFLLTNQVFTQAGWKDRFSSPTSDLARLEWSLRYLEHRFPGRLRIYRVDPISFRGLIARLRYGIRSYPAVLFLQRGQRVLLNSEEISKLEEVVADLLATPETNDGLS